MNRNGLDEDIVGLKISLEEISRELVNLIVEKNELYGDALSDEGFNAITTLLSIKVRRLKNLCKRSKNIEIESATKDTLRDIACYAMLGLLLYGGKDAY